MAIVPDESSTSAAEADFGANDWLLEEMYEQYSADPSSVDETWAVYFKAHGAPSAGAGDGAADRSRSRRPPLPRSPRPAVVSRPRLQQLPAPAPAQASPAPSRNLSRLPPVALRRSRSPRQPRKYGRVPRERGGSSC